MFTPSGAQGPRRPALLATRSGLAALLGVLMVGVGGGSATSSRTVPIVLTGYGNSGLESASGSTSSPAAPQTQTTGSFRIAGSVGGLYPGLSRPLVLTVSNPQAFTIVVTSITTTVTDASAACLASNLSVSAFSGQLSVPGFGTAQTSVLASMAQNAPDACIGATFPLAYSGLAGKLQR
jgi:hypothetical protein